jgi:hypothetical protein
MLVSKNNLRLVLSVVVEYHQTIKPYIDEAVFCIDNVLISVFVMDLVEFGLSLEVTVLSCFLVNPRRSQWQQKENIFPNRNRPLTGSACLRNKFIRS